MSWPFDRRSVSLLKPIGAQGTVVVYLDTHTTIPQDHSHALYFTHRSGCVAMTEGAHIPLCPHAVSLLVWRFVCITECVCVYENSAVYKGAHAYICAYLYYVYMPEGMRGVWEDPLRASHGRRRIS
jgi:hypothetical protein